MTKVPTSHHDPEIGTCGGRGPPRYGPDVGGLPPADRSIRISDRIQSFPDWVIDYVVLHELAHLVVANHNSQFWALVARYPRAERARGYLEGLSAAAGLGMSDD